MPTQPTLQTDRLLLRPFSLEDTADVQRLAGALEVAEMTCSIPHPYPDGAAQAWINSHQEAFDSGHAVHWAVTQQDTGQLIGAMGLMLVPEHRRAELGYWIGVPYWGHGYATEAARAAVEYGFAVLDLRRITCSHFGRNPASGRVMQKVGMTREGILRQHIQKWDVAQDLVLYAILAEEWAQGRA